MLQVNKNKGDDQLVPVNFVQIFHTIADIERCNKKFLLFFRKKKISHYQLFHSDLTVKFLELNQL